MVPNALQSGSFPRMITLLTVSQQFVNLGMLPRFLNNLEPVAVRVACMQRIYKQAVGSPVKAEVRFSSRLRKIMNKQAMIQISVFPARVGQLKFLNRNIYIYSKSLNLKKTNNNQNQKTKPKPTKIRNPKNLLVTTILYFPINPTIPIFSLRSVCLGLVFGCI